MVVIDASALVNALLVDGTARSRLAAESLQAPELLDAELLSVLRRLVLAGKLQNGDALQALATAYQLGLGPAPQPLGLRRALRGAGRATGRALAHR
jgi:predicted nucleic acid-binding protein